jgi:hypothetical protein
VHAKIRMIYISLTMLLVDRVKWFSKQASQDHRREEVEILIAEFERTIVSHSQMADVWRKLAINCGMRCGAAAYAWKKHVMYTDLAKHCVEWFDKAKTEKQ